MEHYFSPEPDGKLDRRMIHATLLEKSFSFVTDAGVFSKRMIDFGSRLLIESVSVGQAEKILDLGCGYGPIGIVMASVSPTARVVMVDINSRAIELAKINAQKNRVIDQTEIIQSDGFSEILDRKFHLILFNPPIRAGKSVIYPLFVKAQKHLEPQGRFCVVIRKQQGAETAKKELNRLFSDVEVITKKKGYWILQGTKI